MNCFWETVAGLYMSVKRRIVTEPPDEEVITAQDGLEQCRRNMETNERELRSLISKLGVEAVTKKKSGDMPTARSKVMERRRAQKRLDRLRHGLDLLDSQLDAIRTSELDKQIMMTLKSSTAAMKRAGITIGIKEAEKVMEEMDDQLREVNDVTTALSTSIPVPGLADVDLEDVDQELDLLEFAPLETERLISGAGAAKNPPLSPRQEVFYVSSMEPETGVIKMTPQPMQEVELGA